VTTAVLTVASRARAAHVDRQRAFLAQLERPDVLRAEAWLDPEPPTGDGILVHVPPGEFGLRVGEGRNAAAAAAIAGGADLLIFLDADCLPGPGLIERYEAVAREPGLYAGPVTYLAEGSMPEDLRSLEALTRPHAARPWPADAEVLRADPAAYDLFWSLSFAVSVSTWEEIGGFSQAFQGYGAEDTDFAWRAREMNVPLLWVGGAHAYHQWHPTSDPPWQHLDDILRNGAAFARRWGRWPMSGWLEKFERAGAITRDGEGWRRV
jgi:N-acetylglucosaminyl-diphospho-decaprenol L-rhamnosyltransferase